jgi:hypothetical protein
VIRLGDPRRAPSVMCTPMIHLVIASLPAWVMTDSSLTDIAVRLALRHDGSLASKHRCLGRRMSRTPQGCATGRVASQEHPRRPTNHVRRRL